MNPSNKPKRALVRSITTLARIVNLASIFAIVVPPRTTPEDLSLARVALWAKTFGGNDFDQLGAFAVAATGDIIAVGHTTSTDGSFPATHGTYDALAVRFTPDGTLLWAKT
jgi:hypothetical protein